MTRLCYASNFSLRLGFIAVMSRDHLGLTNRAGRKIDDVGFNCCGFACCLFLGPGICLRGSIRYLMFELGNYQ